MKESKNEKKEMNENTQELVTDAQVEASLEALTEADEFSGFEMDAESLEEIVTVRVKGEPKAKTPSKKISDAWVQAKEFYVKEKTDEYTQAKAIFSKIHKAFKQAGKDALTINFKNKGLRVTLYAKHDNFRSIERVVRELLFRQMVDGIRMIVPFDKAVELHPTGTFIQGRAGRLEKVVTEGFRIDKV